MKNNLNALYNSVHDDHVKHEVVSQLNAYNGINFGVLDVQTLFDAIKKNINVKKLSVIALKLQISFLPGLVIKQR